MYAFFRNDLLNSIGDQLTPEQIEVVAKSLDKLSTVYSFSKIGTELAVIGRKELQETIAMYLVIRRGEGLASSSEKTMAYVLRAWSNDCTVPLEKLTPNLIRAWLYNYQERNHLSARSIDFYRIIVCGFLKWCASEGYIDKDITETIHKVKFQKKHRKALSQLQLEQVRNACENERERCIVEVLYSTGCRVAELVNIKVSDIDWKNEQIVVTGKGNKERLVYLNAKAEFSIRNYLSTLKGQQEYLIGRERGKGKVSVETVQLIFRKLADRCGIPHHELSPHIMRHTMATQAATVCPIQQVQRMLGHSSINTTMIYAETNDSQIKSGHNLSVI